MRVFVLACLTTTACLSLCTVASLSHAESTSQPMPADNRLVQFVYNPNDTFTVLTRPYSSTHLEMAPDEELEMVVMGDTFQWITQKTPKHFFIKPIKPDIFTSATLITSKRTYQLTFRASPENGKWMQRVSWHYPDIAMLTEVLGQRKAREFDAEQKRLADIVPVTGLQAERMNFDYQIAGDAPFKPVTVFDDGKFVYVRFAPITQEMPAIFMLQSDGALSLVNYVVKGDLIVIQRLVERMLLKIGKAEVRVMKSAAVEANKSWFPFFK